MLYSVRHKTACRATKHLLLRDPSRSRADASRARRAEKNELLFPCTFLWCIHSRRRGAHVLRRTQPHNDISNPSLRSRQIFLTTDGVLPHRRQSETAESHTGQITKIGSSEPVRIFTLAKRPAGKAFSSHNIVVDRKRERREQRPDARPKEGSCGLGAFHMV